jgi:hypothetical protein
VCHCLAVNRTFTDLDLRCVQLTRAQVLSVMDAVVSSKVVQRVDLRGTGASAVLAGSAFHAQKLSERLRDDKVCQSLRLTDGADEFELKVQELRGGGGGSSAAAVLAQALPHTLDLSQRDYRPTSPLDVFICATLLEQNFLLTTLVLDGVCIFYDDETGLAREEEAARRMSAARVEAVQRGEQLDEWHESSMRSAAGRSSKLAAAELDFAAPLLSLLAEGSSLTSLSLRQTGLEHMKEESKEAARREIGETMCGNAATQIAFFRCDEWKVGAVSVCSCEELVGSRPCRHKWSVRSRVRGMRVRGLLRWWTCLRCFCKHGNGGPVCDSQRRATTERPNDQKQHAAGGGEHACDEPQGAVAQGRRRLPPCLGHALQRAGAHARHLAQ